MSLYVISVNGWECYEPHWFETQKSQEEFKVAFQECLKKVIPKAKDNYITGHEIMDIVVPMLCDMGYKLVKPDMEIDIRGECVYREDDKPDVFPDDFWKDVLKHNEAIHKELYGKNYSMA